MLQLRILAGCLIFFSTASSLALADEAPAAGVTQASPSVFNGSPPGATATTTSPAALSQPEPTLRNAQVVRKVNFKHLRIDRCTARQMAQIHWLDKAAASNPDVIVAITQHPRASKILAMHPRLGDIAEADHYLCRRLTRWKDASFALAQNGQAERVIALDPEGMYRAIARWPSITQVLCKNPLFNQMLIDTPDLSAVMAQHM